MSIDNVCVATSGTYPAHKVLFP